VLVISDPPSAAIPAVVSVDADRRTGHVRNRFGLAMADEAKTVPFQVVPKN
jgi:hypothetical protein